MYGLQNIPDDPDRAIAHGRAFCTELLDPLEETFGRVAVRSGYRSPTLNRFGNENRLNCARNDNPLECHIWDRAGDPIAGASIVIPWFTDQYDKGRDWRDLAWWMHDHLPYSEIWFFPKLAAFNLVWRETPLRPRRQLHRAKGHIAESRGRASRSAGYASKAVCGLSGVPGVSCLGTQATIIAVAVAQNRTLMQALR